MFVTPASIRNSYPSWESGSSFMNMQSAQSSHIDNKSSVPLDQGNGTSPEADEGEGVCKEVVLYERAERNHGFGFGAAPYYFLLQEARIHHKINLGNEREAIELAVEALCGSPEPPLFFRVKWESFIAQSEFSEPACKRDYAVACLKSLVALAQAVESVRDLRAEATGRQQMMYEEFKYIRRVRDQMLDVQRKLTLSNGPPRHDFLHLELGIGLTTEII
ncbi:hypothetical protein IWZ01DRAFT_543323 [Phyllosticta capitalensis]